ncbi:adenosylcobinamide-GDP ribazoletransferase [Desulfurispora thermophila]|uniref:adenosylcobinamide-GDP ribazoletransferase n=1 Tax=Desulfurispora thermophila TaxID=265470 RepID=UPI00035F1A8B|nr:adenosylcobinamide-GDP ribazoletransferase [Desulfurispora thermophila]
MSWPKSLAYAVQHLTRLHIWDGEFDPLALGRSGMFFPLAGLLLGSFLVGIYWLCGMVFPPLVTAALLVVGLVLLTGGLHLDGFMDTMDGVLSGRSPERKLEIMRDSRVGAFGALSVVCLLMLKLVLIFCLPAFIMPRVLLLVPVLSRWGMLYVIARFPYARPEGLGRLFHQYTGGRELAVGGMTALLAGGLVGGPGGLVLLLTSTVLAHGLGRWWQGHLGGLTGDTYGATNEILEVCLLMAVYPLYRLAGIHFWWM